MTNTLSLEPASQVNVSTIIDSAVKVEAPFYLYDQAVIDSKCDELKSMPNAFGLMLDML